MGAMDLKPGGAKVVDLSTRFETLPVESDVGPVLWADVEITYTQAGLGPTVVIRVPVPFEAGDTEAQRKAQALRRARLLIDHACQAAGVPAEPVGPQTIQDVIEDIVPPALEGVAQELGLATPTTRPKRMPRRQKPA